MYDEDDMYDDNNITDSEYPQREHNIPLNGNRNIRVKCIVTTEFDWVFKAFSGNNPIESMHPKILRALLARTYDLVRCDIPRKTVEVDFETLEQAVANGGELGTIYGFTTIGDATKVNAQFRLRSYEPKVVNSSKTQTHLST